MMNFGRVCMSELAGRNWAFGDVRAWQRLRFDITLC